MNQVLGYRRDYVFFQLAIKQDYCWIISTQYTTVSTTQNINTTKSDICISIITLEVIIE